MGTYISQTDLENALSPETMLALFDDTNTRVVSTTAVAAVIARAEAMVRSFLIGFYGMPLAQSVDELVKHAALEYAVAYSYERNPDYMREFKLELAAKDRADRADKLMLRIQAAIQKLPDQPNPTTAPKNVGGVVLDTGPRLSIPSADGTDNGAGF